MDETHMHHGRHWSGQRVRGWWASEKYRGACGGWDGFEMWSRAGHLVRLPRHWLEQLPVGVPLVGEVWSGRGPAHGEHEVAAAQAVTHSRFTPRLKFLVYEAPSFGGTWTERIAAAAALLQGRDIVRPVGFVTIEDARHLESLWAKVARKGGEGLMVRDPLAEPGHRPGRDGELLKIKFDPAQVRGVVRCF